VVTDLAVLVQTIAALLAAFIAANLFRLGYRRARTLLRVATSDVLLSEGSTWLILPIFRMRRQLPALLPYRWLLTSIAVL
jgi:hypothetical protein